MAEFDVNRYFQQAAENINSASAQPDPWKGLDLKGSAKQQKLQEASARKVQALREQEARRQQTWAGQMGLSPDSVPGGLVNLGASAASATTEALGDLGALPFSANAMMAEKDIPEDVYQAYSRYQQGNATDQDMAVLNQRTPNELAMRERDGYTPDPNAKQDKPTFLQTLELANRNRETAGDIDQAMDTSGIVDRTAQSELSSELRAEGAEGVNMLNEAAKAYENGEVFDAAKQAALGLADLVAVGGSALATNKQAVLEYAAEIVPDLVIGYVSSPALVARNIGYGLDAYNEGLKNYAEDNNGQAPNAEERRWMAANAFGMALMDTVGETTLLKTMKHNPAKGKVGSAGRTVKAGATGFGTEAGTEGVQTAMEGEATARPASGLDIFEGAVIGGGAGGTVSTGGRAVAEAAGATEEQEELRKQEKEADTAESRTVAETIAAGDFETVLDPDKTPADKAAIALFEVATSEKASEEEKNVSRRALAEMETSLDKAVREVEAEYKGVDPKGRKNLTETIKSIDALIKAEKADGNRAAVKQLQQTRDEVKDRLKKLNTLPSGERKRIQDKLGKLRAAQDIALRAREDLNRRDSEAGQRTQLVDKVTDNTLDTETRSKAAQESVMLLMENPRALSDEDIERLSSEADTLLTDENQKNYLRTLSQAAIARNAAATLESTREDIFGEQARSGFKSLPQYRSAASAALETGNVQAAQEELAGLREWARSHETKARLAQQAVSQAQPGRQMALWADPTADGGWRLRPGRGKADDAALRTNGGLQFSTSTKSQELADSIATEARAITATAEELAAAIQAKQGQTVTAPQAQPEAASDDSPAPSVATPVTEEIEKKARLFKGFNKLALGTSTGVLSIRAAKALPRFPASISFRARMSEESKKLLNSYIDNNPEATTREVFQALQEQVTYVLRPRWVMGSDIPKGRVAQNSDITKRADEVKSFISDASDELNNVLKEHANTEKDAKYNYPYPEVIFKDWLDRLSNKAVSPTAEEEVTDAQESANETVNEPEAPVAEEATGNGETAPEAADGTTESGTQGEPKPEPETVDETGTDQPDDTTGTVYGLTFKPVEGHLPIDQFEQTNLLEAYFSVRKTGDDQTKMPMTTRENFVSEVVAPATSEEGATLAPLADFVSNLGEAGTELAEKQCRLLRLFSTKALAWQATLNIKVFKPKTNLRFRYEDFVQFLAQDGELPENVTSAISVAAFTWVQENGNESAFNDDDAIRSILGKSDNEPVTSAEKDLLGDAGTYEDNVISDLGRRAATALGLKLNASAPVNHQAQLEGALGLYALDLLIQEGYIERHAKQSPLLKGGGKAAHWFVRLNRDYNNRPYPLAGDGQAIVDAGKGTQGVLQKLFAIEPRVKGPSFEPLKRKQQTTKGTDETIPSEQKRIIEDEMTKTAWILRSDMKGLVDTLLSELGDQGKTALYRMAGAVDLENYTPQESNRKSLEGKNSGLQREVDHLLDFYNEPAFVDGGHTRPFWFPLSVWVNQRVGMDTNTVNPLSSKVHRFMMQLPEWTHQIETDPLTEAGQHKLRQFKLAALEGLGYGVDKLSNDTALTAFDSEVAKAQPHIDTIGKLMTGQAVEPEAVTAMTEFVARAEQFHTLDALVHLSRWQQAGDSFTSSLVREGDGITNGPALATILSGAWRSQEAGLALVNKMGFFEKGNPHQSAGAWQEDPNNNDLYETLAERVDTLAQEDYRAAPGNTRAKYFAIFSLLGSFRDSDNSVSKKGRKRVKTPLTGMAFGASPAKSIRNMGHEMVDVFFEDLEKALNDPDVRKGNARIKGLVNAINTLLPPKQHLVVKNRNQAQKLTVSPEQRNRIVAEFERTLGAHVKQALDEQFGQFIEFRNKMNKMASHAYEMFMLAREQERQAFLTEQDLPVDRSGNPLQSFTKAQEKELQARLKAVNPVMHTAMSKASKELKSGLHISATSMKSQYPDSAYLAKASFKRPFPVSNADTDTKKTLDIYGKAMSYDHPGVRMFITGVHSLDSAIASRTYKDYPALNVHDAEIVAAHMMQEVAGRMNQETFKALRDYSLPTEVMTMVSRVYDGFSERLDSLDPAAIKKAFPKGLKQVQADMGQAFQAANIAEAIKLSLLAQIQTVNQYGVEGGEYQLTQADYDSIAELQKATVVDRVKATLTAGGKTSTVAENVAEWMKGNSKEPARPEPLPEGRTVWGQLGAPAAPSDPVLVGVLERNPNMRVRDLLKELPRTPLSVALMRLVDPDLKVKYITKDTPASQLPDTDVSRARGFWTRDNGREFVGIKSPDYVDSGVNQEMVTHETLHAVLFDVVNQAKARDGSARARQFVKEVEQIRGEMIKHLERNGLMGQYGTAVQNTHELIAWGMTNAGFQRELAKVEFQSKNQGLVNGLRKFIDSIKRVLFGNQVPANTGLEGLIVNTAALLEEASRTGNRDGETTLKQEFGPTPETVRNWTTEQVYDGLAGANNDSRVRDLLSTVVEKVHGPFGAWKAQDGLSSPVEVYIEAKATGKMPFASEALTVFPMSDAQAYVLEQVEASLREAMASDSLAYKELVRTFRNARDRLKGVLPKDQYDYLFTLKQVPGSDRTDHLSRFAAMALVEPTVYNALNDTQGLARTTPSDKLGDQLKNWYDRSMQELSNHLNKTHNTQPDNERLRALGERFADIEAKRKADLARDGIDLMDQAESAGRKLGQAARDQISKVANSDAIKHSKNGYIQGLGAVTSVIAEDRVQEMLDALEAYRAYQFKARQGLVGALITEARGATTETQAFHKLLRMAGQNERERKHINENVKKDVKERFVSLDKDDSDAITRVLLRTDVSGLSQEYPPEKLEKMLRDPQVLQKEIARAERQVADLNHHEKHYMAYSKLLGYFMATGEAKGPHLSLNAHNIAALYGTNEPALPNTMVAEAEKVIDPLVTLYALKYTNLSQRKRVADVMRRENPRGKSSGILYVLKLHEKLKEDAKQNLFDGDPSLFMKGYTREIYNPHREVQVADAKKGAELEAQGWIRKSEALEQDPNDPDNGTEKFLYMLPHGGLNARVTGSISLTGERRKGSAIHGGEFMITEQEIHRGNQQTNQALSNLNWKQVRAVGAQGRALDPKNVNDNFLVPVYNQAGEIVNYRYLMGEKAKDDLLERNNRVEDVLGSMASHLYDKVETPKQNRQVVEALKDQYDIEFRRRPSSFIKVGPESDDKQARETYQLLPPATKKVIREVWGGNDMWVRADVYDMVFGYRKYSLSNMFDKEPLQYEVMEKIRDGVVDILSSRWLLGDTAKLRIRQGEDMWQDVVKEIKDAWVIKNVTTLLGNIASNVSILLWSGMNPKKIVETHKTAINGLLQYQDDHNELTSLQREIDLDVAEDMNQARQRVLELRDSMDRNPVKGLIDEGMFQTILEDVDAESDDYSYKARLATKLEEATEKVPQAVKTGARWAYLSRDTAAYKLLFKGTQMSDFVARYALYQHLTTRKNDPMDHDTAIQRIADAFVNYDVPTHRTLQYLNDTGLVFFTKYYLRIQKVLLALFQEKPARGLVLAVMESYLSGLPTVLDSGPRFANPLDTGALNFPSALGEIAPIKLGLSLW